MQQLGEIELPETREFQQVKYFISKDLKSLECEVNSWLLKNSELVQVLDVQYQQHLSFTCMIRYLNVNTYGGDKGGPTT